MDSKKSLHRSATRTHKHLVEIQGLLVCRPLANLYAVPLGLPAQ